MATDMVGQAAISLLGEDNDLANILVQRGDRDGDRGSSVRDTVIIVGYIMIFGWGNFLAINLNIYHFIKYGALEGWWEGGRNFYDDLWEWSWFTFEEPFIRDWVIGPTDSLLGLFLQFDDDLNFVPMLEERSYLFLELIYPYLYLAHLWASPTELSLIPVYLFWYWLKPEIFGTERDEYGDIIPAKNSIYYRY